jgi:hypothetical protein
MRKYLILLVGLGILIAVMIFIVKPLVLEVVASDLFLVQSKDEASTHSISTPLTAIAFGHCNSYIKSELGDKVDVTFPEKPLKAWSFGNYQYIIHSKFTVTGNTSNPKEYTCRITYNNGDDQEGIADFDNWSIDGVSGLEGL